ncbi:glycosyltransferase family 2 protein [Larkinella knui]|nr:glycosyltransferase [Larkinella knui]
MKFSIKMKVSVCIVTYNHAKFVRQTLDSVLSQQTNFDFEVIVGDDLSKDNTRDILAEYQARYPDQIRLLLHPTNLGNNGMHNALSTFKEARGEYIAQMDGDDYWINPHKLQKQADMLDQHPEYSSCFTNAKVVFEDEKLEPIFLVEDKKPVVTIDDLIGEDEIFFMATSSIMFRKNAIPEYPAWYYQSQSGDIPRNVLLAKAGPIGYIDEVMSVYRKNLGGASYADNEKDKKFLNNRILMYSNINRELDYKYDKVLRRNIARYYKLMLEANQYSESYFRRAGIALKYLYLGKPKQAVAKEIIQNYIVPAPVMKLYSAIRLMPYRLMDRS